MMAAPYDVEMPTGDFDGFENLLGMNSETYEALVRAKSRPEWERAIEPRNGRDPYDGGERPLDDTTFDNLTLTLAEWAKLEIPTTDYLLGELFSTTSRAMLSADTGLGKTHLAFAFAFAIAAGVGFCHWAGRRRCRVLIVDGEMSRALLRERLADAEKRLGHRPDTLFALSREDAQGMPPLDTTDGQIWLDTLIGKLGGVDFLILDNLMSLTIGDMKEEDAWRPVAFWLRDLTRRRIGVLLIDHTGHDTGRTYGTRTKTWQLDTVMLGERCDDQTADLSMKLTFPKARQRRPNNRDDFTPVSLKLINNEWVSDKATPERKRAQPDYALELLRRAIEEAGEQVPGQPVGIRGVSLDLWRRYAGTWHLSPSGKPDSQKRAFNRAVADLQTRRRVQTKNELAWIVQ